MIFKQAQIKKARDTNIKTTRTNRQTETTLGNLHSPHFGIRISLQEFDDLALGAGAAALVICVVGFVPFYDFPFDADGAIA